MSNIIWIASYPKSGNTWFRMFLTALRADEGEDVDINEPTPTPIASSRAILDKALGIESSNLTDEEVRRLRPLAYETMFSQEADEPVFMKVHDAWTLLDDGRPVLGAVGGAALYIIRNPLDVAVSNANFNGTDIDKSIARMADPENRLAKSGKRLLEQLPQRLLSWSEHVLSWVDRSGLPVHVLRYEDMSQAPLESFAAAARFAGLDDSPERVARAVEACAFEKLSRQEADKGFKEKSLKQERFFRKGIVGDWRNTLTQQQVERIIAEHGPVMERFGYL